MDLLEIFIKYFFTIAGGILLASFSGYVAWRNGRKTRTANAAFLYRNSIDPNKFDGLQSHILHGALIQTFPELKKAVKEYRLHLGTRGKFSLDSAWKGYHGGNEECPDFLVMYCIHENGLLLLRQRLEQLRKVGEIT